VEPRWATTSGAAQHTSAPQVRLQPHPWPGGTWTPN
jgi:hypothetical protein